MTTDDTQTVTEDQVADDAPNEESEAASEAAGAQDTTDDEWDELLKGSQTESEKLKPEPDESDRVKALEDKIERMESAFSKKDVDEGIASAVGNIKAGNEALKGYPDRAVKSYLYGLAEERPEILTAFGDRHQKPKAWAKAQELIGKEMAKDFADMPDADLTEGVKAAADAVRGVSTTSPATEEHDNAHYAAMKDDKFEATWKEEARVKDAGG